MKKKAVFILLFSLLTSITLLSQERNTGIKLTSGVRIYGGEYLSVGTLGSGDVEKVYPTLGPALSTDFALNFKLTNKVYSIVNVGFSESNKAGLQRIDERTQEGFHNNRRDYQVLLGIGYIPCVIQDKHAFNVNLLGGVYHATEHFGQKYFGVANTTAGMVKLSLGYSYYILPDFFVGATYSFSKLESKGYLNDFGISVGYGF